jgi:DNA-binding NarL/FixJ family response regulator
MIRVFVVEDNPLTRYILRVYLCHESDIELAGECDGTGDVSSEVSATRPDVVLLDYRLPVVKGDVLTRQLKKAQPDVKVLAVSIDTKLGGPAMLAAGADAFLAKTSMDNTVAAVRQVVRRKPRMRAKSNVNI